MCPSEERRRILRATLSLGAVAALGVPPGIRAQQRLELVRVLCGYPAGGSLDLLSRKVAERLGHAYASTSVVENRTGAAGRLAVEVLKTSPADGSVLLVTPGSVVTMYPHVYKRLSYDVFADLTPVAMVAATDFCLAVGESVPAPVRSLDDFLGWCRSNPGQASCGNAGAGSFPHFMALLMARDTGVALTHVPFRGGGPAMLAVAGGQVAAAIATESAGLAMERAGKLRILATTGAERSMFFPQAPTFFELGFRSLARSEWFAAFMPGKAPGQKVAMAAEEIRAMLQEPAARDSWAKMGLSAVSSSSAELQVALKKEFEFWGPIIRASGFTPEA